MKNNKLRKLLLFILVAVILIIIAFIKFTGSYINSPQNNKDQSDSANYDLENYDDLYGTWLIQQYIPSKMKTSLSKSTISFCIGQKFTIEKGKLTSIFATINNPTIEEGIINASDFYKRYNDTFENLGIPGDKVKYFHITKPEETSHSATILIANHSNVYALLGGSLFELKKL